MCTLKEAAAILQMHVDTLQKFFRANPEAREAWDEGKELPARRSTNVPDSLICAARAALIPVSHRLPPRDYNEPESLSYAISSICPVSADGGQEASRERPRGAGGDTAILFGLRMLDDRFDNLKAEIWKGIGAVEFGPNPTF